MNRTAIQHGNAHVPARFWDIEFSPEWTYKDVQIKKKISDYVTYERPTFELSDTEIARFKESGETKMCAGDCLDKYFKEKQNGMA